MYLRMKNGDPNFSVAPVAHVINGPLPYLWIGNNDSGDQRCYATLEGAALRRLRDELTKVLRKAK